MELNRKHFISATLCAVGLCLAGSLSARAATITKADNTLDLTNGLSWAGGVTPGASDLALWDGTVTSANTVSLGGDVSWLGIRILNPGGLVTISGTNMLSLGASGINMASASADLTLAPTGGGVSINPAANQTWNIGGGRTLSVTPDFYLQGGTTLTLAGTGSFVTGGQWLVGTAGSPGVVNHIGGTWSSSKSGTLLFLGNSATLGTPGVGVYNLKGGTITLTGTQELRLGNSTASGNGTLNVTNGAITSDSTNTLLRLGFASGSTGTFNQAGGAVTIGQIDCASYNLSLNGAVSLSGGVLNVCRLNVGTQFYSTGAVFISGGALNLTNFVNLGTVGTGAMTLTNAGWLNLYGTLTVGSATSGSAGTLNLNGGMLNVASNTASISVGTRGTINANGVIITNGHTGSITLSAAMTLGPGGFTLATLSGSARNVTVSAKLSGTGGFTMALGGTCNNYLTGSNSFQGPILLKSGYFHNSGTYAVPVGCNLTNNASWAMDKGVTLGSFSGSGSIFRDGSQGAATLTAGYGDADGVYSGSIGEGTGSQVSLTKIGAGTLTLSGSSSYTGGTTVSNGTLLVNGTLKSSNVVVRAGALLGGGGIILSNVALDSGGGVLFTDTGTLTVGGTITGGGNTIHLSLSSNVPAGWYLLATCGSVPSGTFALTPVVDSGSFAEGTTNTYITTLRDSQIWLVVQNRSSTPAASGQFYWPASQFLPVFPTNASLIECVDISGMSGALVDVFASMQGIVNRTQPRMGCISSGSEEGKWTWFTNHVRNYRMNSGYNLLCRYAGELSGLVVHDTNLTHTLNLATTIAGITNGLICDPSLLDMLTNAPYNLPVLVDLRGKFTDKYQVYGYLYTNYWSQCTHRIIAGMQTNVHGCLRDYLVAVKAACMWLDPGNVTADATALAQFTGGMKAVAGVYMGWVPDEGADVSWLATYGIPVLASDYYLNGSLYSGFPVPINIPAIPSVPTLQNKVYVCFFLSDGDNVAYMQHKMRGQWNDSARGKVPIGWTTSPLACDIDPGMLNYYWNSATSNDCLVSGPSGAGYAKMEYWSAANANAFTLASAPYLKKAGHRVITIWDSLSTANGKYYGTNCPTLAGLTDQSSYYTSTSKGAIPVMGMPAGYAGTPSNLVYGITNTAAGWTGTAPKFIPVQGSGWDISPTELLSVANALDSNYVVVRPDVFFLLYKQYMGQGVVVDPAPTNVVAVRRYNGDIALAWRGSADASSYKVARSTSSGSEVLIGSALTTNFCDSEVSAGTTYYYRVATENLAGVSGYSSEIVVPPAVLAPGSYSATVMHAGPLAYWPLNESTGPVAYDLAGGYDGAYTGGCTLAQPGIANGGFGFSGSYGALFDGTSGYVQIPQGPFNLTNALTIMAWVKVPATPHFSGVVGRGDSSWRLSVNASGKPGADNAHVYGDVTAPASIVGTNWHMLVYTCTGIPNVTNNGRLYVDGAVCGTNTVGTLPGNSSDVWIGGSPDYGTARLLPGSIAQVAVFTNALSAAQVQSLYQAGTNTAPMIGLIPLGSPRGMEVVWSQGSLAQATNLAGPWLTNTAASPVIIQPTNAQMFFRVR
jgi:autotransporter-associated beta strand protein